MKSYVCTVTPNPALDLGGVVDKLKPNEKSYVHDETTCAGGNGINVARILTRLKVPVVATGFLGGSTGKEIKYLLDQEGVKNSFTQIKAHSRISVTVSNRADHRQTRLSFPGPSIQQIEKNRFFKFLERTNKISLCMIGGSLPMGFKSSDILHLIKLAKKLNIDSIVDCPGNIMREVIAGQPLLIKPNLEEFHEMTQSQVKSLSSVQREAKKLLADVPYVCISSVEQGALLVTRNGTYFGCIPKVKIKSTVGAGDSMVGAMTAQIYNKNYSGEELLRWGLAASAATLAEYGTSMGQASEIQRLYKITQVKFLR